MLFAVFGNDLRYAVHIMEKHKKDNVYDVPFRAMVVEQVF